MMPGSRPRKHSQNNVNQLLLSSLLLLFLSLSLLLLLSLVSSSSVFLLLLLIIIIILLLSLTESRQMESKMRKWTDDLIIQFSLHTLISSICKTRHKFKNTECRPPRTGEEGKFSSRPGKYEK